MNIFYLDADPRQSAEYHCDAHIRKMVVEYAQLLCNQHWLSDDEADMRRAINNTFFKPTHTTHKCTKWVGLNAFAYAYVYIMWEELQNMYITRYAKHHGSMRLLDPLLTLPTRLYNGMTEDIEDDTKFPTDDLSPPPMCFGKNYDYLKVGVDIADHNEVVSAYRNYYRAAKNKFASWGGDRKLPSWWLQSVG
tara:strand:- start:3734 stop:4309 length:576 start_codon:yes stop_codon:yes gene_type:complete